MQYPKIMQPTHARWETFSPLDQKLQTPQISATEVNGDDGGDTLHPTTIHEPPQETIFPQIASVYTRNFMISDTYYTSPASSIFGYPGPDEHVIDVGPGGLTNIQDNVIAALPEDCRQAFLEARAEEEVWKASWGSETDDTARAELRITYNI